MKALSIRQPWADLIACGEKTVEVRSWKTKHEGPLLIVSSKGPSIAWAEHEWGFLSKDQRLKGYALAIVQWIDYQPMDMECTFYSRTPAWDDGDWAWTLGAVKKIDPFPVKGRQGLFNVEVPE